MTPQSTSLSCPYCGNEFTVTKERASKTSTYKCRCPGCERSFMVEDKGDLPRAPSEKKGEPERVVFHMTPGSPDPAEGAPPTMDHTEWDIPPEDRRRVFGNLPVGLMGATPGAFGTAFSQYAWLPVLRVLGLQVWSGRLMWVGGAMQKFDKEGNLTDDGVMKQLTKYMSGFAHFVTRMKT